MVKDRDIMVMVGLLVLIDIIILIVWETSSPFYQSLTSDAPYLNPLNVNELHVPSRERCGSDNFSSFVITMLVYKGALLLSGVYLTIRVRKIQVSNLNDSKWIGISIYNVVST